ncbi:MAG: NAD-dependent epimerase/dehydratase family protein, partial [Bacteriovoracaceae bacterium]|nr:NAD-dependent epimerase/dehydratase family protein [Bacteriovoracaceae bacterium]
MTCLLPSAMAAVISAQLPVKILLTGGSGFIGRNIRESFLGQKYSLAAPSRQEMDLADQASVDQFWQDKQFDVVIHAATKPGHRNARDPEHILAANLLYLENLLRHQDKFKKFINLGSGAIYDLTLSHHQVTEDQIGHLSLNQTSLSKYIIQQRLKSLPAAVDLNIFGIFGKYEDWEIRFISNAICKALYHLPITLRQNRRFSYLV